MFHKLKARLTLLYTFSLLLLLLCFIGLLYFLISQQIQQNENDSLQSFFYKQKMDLIEDFYEKEHRGLAYDPNKEVFYYVFDKKGQLVYGNETIKGLSGWLEAKSLQTKSNAYTKKTIWKQTHLYLMKKPLETNGYVHGYVIFGLDSTSEKHLIDKITWSLVILTLLFSILYGGAGYYFAGQAIRPIKAAFQKQEKFVSDASHELRTPLSIFYSSIDLLMEEEKQNLSPFGLEVLQDAKAETELMNKLVHDLLFLARSDKKELPLDINEVNLSERFTSLSKRFSRKLSGEVPFIQNIEPGIHFACDVTRIQQLLYILLDNAFRYTKEGQVVLALAMKAEKIVITVSDTGCGIRSSDIPQLFDRFYRGDLSREKGGFGLGLSIAKAIVNAHGGKIYVSSEYGKGSEFTVVFFNSKRM